MDDKGLIDFAYHDVPTVADEGLDISFFLIQQK
jgi:hypothetical protein